MDADLARGRIRMEPVSLLLPPEMLARLDKAAAKAERSRAWMARRLLEGALSEQNARGQ